MIGNFVGIGQSLFEKSRFFREVGLDTTTVKRLVLIECKKNLSLMEPLKLDESGIPQNAAAMVAVAARIQFDAIEYLLTADDTAIKAFKELGGIPFESSTTTGNAVEYEIHEPVDSKIALSERLQKLYVRMYAAKTLAEIVLNNADGDFDGAGQIQFKKRLTNMQMILKRIDQLLSSEMSREISS